MHCELHECQRVHEPEQFARIDEKKPENDDRANDVGEDEKVLAVVTIGGDTGERADEKRREHPGDEEAANRDCRTGERCDEGSRRD